MSNGNVTLKKLSLLFSSLRGSDVALGRVVADVSGCQPSIFFLA